ncbi:MAG TPA: hypothetical protein VJC15_03100 [Candidatus Paceibacterota bacterium]
MHSHDLVVWGLIIFFVGLAILGLGIPMGFDHSFTTGLVVMFSSMVVMSVGLLVALFGLQTWIRSLRSRPR